MFPTAYKGITPLHRNSSFNGGICKFFYIPVEDVAAFPRINPENQQLIDEPLLKIGKSWFGPIQVPKDKLGFTEVMKRDKAGFFYEIKVSSFHIGDSKDSRVNLQNMPYHRYLVVGKVRAGGFYIIIGTMHSFCQFSSDYSSGNGPGDPAQSQFSFTTEQRHPALIMPGFTGDIINPEEGGNGGDDDPNMNNKEIIPFENQSSVQIVWTGTRQQKFGSYPIIEIYIKDGEEYYLHVAGEIKPDIPPPAFTQLTVNIGGENTGFIVIG
ncbi:MAG: hypothetical protein ACTHMV_13645 [Chitinophagaceae bacterium]